jgi:hypothetical protein
MIVIGRVLEDPLHTFDGVAVVNNNRVLGGIAGNLNLS